MGVGGPGNHREASRLSQQSPTPPPHIQPSPGLGKDSTACPVPLKGSQGMAWTQPMLWVASLKGAEIPQGAQPEAFGTLRDHVAQRGGSTHPRAFPGSGGGPRLLISPSNSQLWAGLSPRAAEQHFPGTFLSYFVTFKTPIILCGVERERRGTDYKSNMLFEKMLKNIEKHREEIM